MDTTTVSRGAVAADAAVLEGSFSKLSWRSVFGGTFAALGAWILLGAFGLAIGLTAVSPEDPSLKGVAIWLGIWTLIVPILAMFLGTLVATWASASIRKGTGMMYGVVVWGLTTFLATVFVVMLLGSAVGQTLRTTASLISGVGSAVASAVEGVGGGGQEVTQAAESVGGFLGIDRSDLVAALNRQLEQEGKPPVELSQVQAAAQQAANAALREGRFSTEVLIDALAQQTALDRQDVRSLAQQIGQQWNETMGGVTSQLSQMAGAAGDTALRALNAVGVMFWLVFGSLLLGLAASLAAGVLATTRNHGLVAQRIAVARPEEVSTTRNGASKDDVKRE